MSKGYYIGLNDKTTCGGTVLDGDTRIMMYGIAHAKEGDRVTCGKSEGIYQIVGGISHMISHGKRMAGTLDSYSNCPCKARLIHSVETASYRNAASPASQPAARTAQPAAPAATPQSAAPSQSAFAPSSQPVPPVFNTVDIAEPGFYVVPNSMTREQLEATLFPSRSAAVMSKFNALNPGTGDIKAGSMIVLSDPHNTTCTYQEAQLMQVAQEVKTALDPLTPGEADFMHRHAAEIVSFTGHTSTVLGVSAAVMENHIRSLRDILQKIERLHQDNYRQHGHLRSPSFFADRKHLLTQLDAHMLSSTRLRGKTTLGDHPKLKTALGISTRSLVHHWDKAGGPGQIPGYSNHVNAVSRAAKYMQNGGYIGIGIGAVSSLLAIQEVCVGDPGAACERIRFTEGGKFFGAATVGAAGGAGASIAARPVCLLLGATGIGGVICLATTVGVGAYYGTKIGEKTGEGIGEIIYEKFWQ
jgi:uncharacterized Zn-binding protein involved in type VI secretion/thiamine phosphate synthase YjbQ (UPF0047 family)